MNLFILFFFFGGIVEEQILTPVLFYESCFCDLFEIFTKPKSQRFSLMLSSRSIKVSKGFKNFWVFHLTL